ncbi:hypothetical protein ElyMa_006069400 [Elysia marginata]|uniref:Uncharacterized protein n=1 Tax=Elysia marginata TaxID=1093978 RepID=A0AAV4GQ45_9GAST|nr:hypothetical protein ElyMa_006069400 [Elysia marginata]
MRLNIFPEREPNVNGSGSWSFYNADIASGTAPGSHAKCVHTPLDQGLLEPYLLFVHERLTDEEFLQRCESRSMQNANESLHNCIWLKVPEAQVLFTEKG